MTKQEAALQALSDFGQWQEATEVLAKRIAELEASNKQLQHDLNEQLHQVKAYDARCQQLEDACDVAMEALDVACAKYADVGSADWNKWDHASMLLKEVRK